MKLSKGKKIVFKDRTEVVVKANNDPINGTIKTDKNEYSTDFINRWIKFGFISIQ